MIKFSEILLSDLEKELKHIHSEGTDALSYSQHAINILISAWAKLKNFFLQYNFENEIEEIVFFRDIKPQFASKLIYYNEVFTISANKPLPTKKLMRKYYSSELKKLQAYVDENIEFYKYYRTGCKLLDNKYFLRGKPDILLTLDSFYLQSDHRFSTSHDHKVARILANDLIKEYLEGEIDALEKNIKFGGIIPDKKIKWTGSKVALVELIYALHSDSLFNDGKAELKQTVRHFETMFNIDLGQFHRTFLEIRNRKSDRTKFLNTLTRTLERRMDDADEN